MPRKTRKPATPSLPFGSSDCGDLNECQKSALALLESDSNIFVTGVAGSGKTHLIRHFLRSRAGGFPVLASTGAAAVLVGGRTFHSFFGLGIMQGGVEATVERALKNSRLKRRLKDIHGVVIDEVSMLSGPTLRAADLVCRALLDRSQPWGGLQVIAVGDFAQLPPVSYGSSAREWAFRDEAWESTGFVPAYLRTVMRTRDLAFQTILNDIRNGKVSQEVTQFLNSRKLSHPEEFLGTRLFAHRETTEKYNLQRLETMEGEKITIRTEYSGTEKGRMDLLRVAPIPEVLQLKEGARVMLRQNDVLGRWVNGSLGEIRSIDEDELEIELHSGREVVVEKASFTLLDAEGNEVASAKNFPVNLAYATTIHKAQGLTLDSVLVDLRNLWEPGQAYVALSRVKESTGVFVTGWAPQSIQMDLQVRRFYEAICGNFLEISGTKT